MTFKLLNVFYSGKRGENITQGGGKKISKLLSEATLEQISSLNDPSFAGNTPNLH